MSAHQLKDGRWYVKGRPGFFPEAPERTREYFGRGIQAEKAAHKRNAECLGAKAAPVPLPSGPTFAALAAEYFKHRDFNPKSRRELQIKLERIILPQLGHRSAIHLTEADLDRYVAHRRKQKTRRGTRIKDGTIRREITMVKAILNWSAGRKPPLIKFNPVTGFIPPAADDDVILPPTAEEAEAIYQAASDHLRRCIILSWFLGLRPGAVELLSLTHQDVSLEVGIIRIRSAAKGGPRFRDVPIHSGLRAHLERWQKEDKARQHRDRAAGPLVHYHGKAIGKIQTSWEGALLRAGIKRRIRPYDLRHHFITRALESGADIGALAEIVGSRPETLRRHYQHVSSELTRRTVELIPELDTTGTPGTRGAKPAPGKRRRERV
jgi:integrase